MIFDTHAHYDDRRFDGDRFSLLAALRRAGIGALVNVGAGLSSTEAGLKLAEAAAARQESTEAEAGAWPRVYASAGVHPDEVQQLEELGEEQACEWFKEQLQSPFCLAIGEIGLDRHGEYPDKTSPALQERWLRFQLGLAREKGLPVLIHSREAAADTLRIIREEGGSDLRLLMHCFSYEKELARAYLDMGHFLGIGGVVTYKNGRKLKEVVQYVPADRILLETDSPYLAPEPLRGSRNDSRNLRYVLEEIARLKGLDREELEQLTWDNACRFYGVGPEP